MNYVLFFIGICVLNYVICDQSFEKYVLSMPQVLTDHEDVYVKVNFPPPSLSKTIYVKEIIPQPNTSVTHHMILRGCTEMPVTFGKRVESENCLNVLYAWAHNAPKLTFPLGVGLPVGPNSEFKAFQLEMHYKNVVDYPDTFGLTLIVTEKVQPRIVGTFVLGSDDINIPPNSNHVNADVSCR